jgi:hypothetical protein
VIYQSLWFYADEKLISLIMSMKAQLDTVVHQQQTILQEVMKARIHKTPRLPGGMVLPLQTFDQVQSLERKLLSVPLDKQGLVSASNRSSKISSVNEAGLA